MPPKQDGVRWVHRWQRSGRNLSYLLTPAAPAPSRPGPQTGGRRRLPARGGLVGGMNPGCASGRGGGRPRGRARGLPLRVNSGAFFAWKELVCTARDDSSRRKSRCSPAHSNKWLSNGVIVNKRLRRRSSEKWLQKCTRWWRGCQLPRQRVLRKQGGKFASSHVARPLVRCKHRRTVPLSVALERADYANGCFKNQASAEKLCILSENAAAASAQALAELLLLCDGILTSNLATDRAP